MATIRDGQVHVFTFKDGILSRLGHDLRMTLHRFEITVENKQITGRFFTDNLELDGVMRAGELIRSEPSQRDRRDIHDTMRKKILHQDRHPEVRLDARVDTDAGDTIELSGNLELVGRTEPLSLTVRRDGGRLHGEIRLVPSRWGIPPFKALLGALRLQDRVDVRFDLPDPQD